MINAEESSNYSEQTNEGRLPDTVNASIENHKNRISHAKNTNEQRKNLIRLVFDQGFSIKESSENLAMNYSSARGIVNRFRKTGIINQLSKGGKTECIATQDILIEIDSIISLNPELTLKEIKSRLQLSLANEFSISTTTIDRCLRELKITFKISHRELDRVNAPEKIILRKEYSLWFNNHFVNDLSRVIFIDETSCNLHIKRTQARSRQGSRAVVSTPTIRGRSISMIASMSISKMCYCKVISNSTVNGDIFSTYLSELCVYLRDEIRIGNACLILDNARVHKRNEIQRITEQFGFEFKFLSPYSYMLNPLENAFSQIKNGIRSRLRQSENISLSDLMLSEAMQITPENTSSYFRYILRNITNCAAELPYIHQ